MKFYSTSNKKIRYSFKDATIKGLAPDRGLFFPEYIPKLDEKFLKNLNDFSLDQIAYEVLKSYTEENISESDLKQICKEVFNFDIPLVEVSDSIYSLELFHGPTCAFKDVGARFMSRALGHFSDKNVVVLVATSGDTGSAVANGFYNVPGVDVVILYPSGKVSEIQEKQLTTLGGNIKAIEVSGTFDDCQEMVKEAFQDEALNTQVNLTSANSINIARWIPQSVYYFWTIAQLENKSKDTIISVPSGNFGNLTAGILAKKMGLKIHKFIAATNSNDIIPNYLKSGEYKAKPSISTHANAMDVGDPSNFVRLKELYSNNFNKIKDDIMGFTLNDQGIEKTLSDVYRESNYILDPHGAIGIQSLKDNFSIENNHVFLETAHPAKFAQIVEKSLKIKVAMPSQLAAVADKEKVAAKISNDYRKLSEFLHSNF